MGTTNILVIGNREISRTIVNALIPKDGPSSYKVTVLTYPSQSPDLPPHISPQTIKHTTSDFSAASLERAFAGQDLVISTIGGGNYELQARIIDAAIAAGVKKYIPHEFGQDTLNENVRKRVSGGADRAKALEHLRRAHEADPRFEWAAVAVGCILDPMLLTGNLGFDLQWHSAAIPGTGQEIFPASSLERVGTVTRRVIEHWSDAKNQFLYAPGVLTSGHGLLDSLEKISGESWSVGYSEVADCVREGDARIERGFVDSGMFLLERSVLYDEGLGAADHFRERNANGMLGLGEEDVDAVVSKVYHDFRHRGRPGCGCT